MLNYAVRRVKVKEKYTHNVRLVYYNIISNHVFIYYIHNNNIYLYRKKEMFLYSLENTIRYI